MDIETSIPDEIDPNAVVHWAGDEPFAAAIADVPDDDSLAMLKAMTLAEPIGTGALQEVLAWAS